MATDEPVVSRNVVTAGSDRSFGLVFATFFCIVGLWPVMSGDAPRLWALGLASIFALVAVAAPRALSPLNKLWFRLGLVLHHVVNPIVMALIYYGTVVPIGLILKSCGKKLLPRTREPQATSYWIAREPPGPPRGSMLKQF